MSRQTTMSIETITFVIRRARMNDRNHLRAMQAESMRALAAKCYSAAEIEAFLIYVGTVNDQLIDEGTYYVVEGEGHIVASGGWSRLGTTSVTATGGDPAASLATAKVRSVFVHPDWARHGLGRKLMQRVEAEAWSAGFNELEMNVLLSGVPFYCALGYQPVRPIALSLPDNLMFRGTAMRKSLENAVAAPAETGVIDRRQNTGCCGQAA